jgi:hypothetical protein
MARPNPLAAASAGTRTAIEPGLVGRITGAVRYVLTGASDAWMGPSQPLAPQAGQPQDQTRGRAFDYQVGQNLQQQPRATEGTTFAQLRGLADALPILRLVIETRKDQMARLKWSVVPRDEEQEGDPRCDKAMEFFRRPDQEHDWHDWLRMLLEEMLVIDAATIYPRPTVGGGVYGFDLIDGATIKRVIDGFGRTPTAPQPAFQQVLKGLPAVDYTIDELVYRPRNLRVSKLYGLSPVEQILLTVNIALRRDANTLSFYTEGNTPDLLIGTPPEWNPDQIRIMQEWFDSIGSGQTKKKAKFIPGGMTPFDTKAAALKDEFDEWLARIVCFAFSISPTPFIKAVNRATAETAHQQALEEGLAPLMLWVKATMDVLIGRFLGCPDLEWRWNEEQSIDPLIAAQIAQIYVAEGVITPDEARADLGREPLTAAQKEELAPTPAPALLPVAAKAPPMKEPKPDGVGKLVKKNSLTQRTRSAPY